MAHSWIARCRVDSETERFLRETAAKHFSLRSSYFPGTQPVSFRRCHLSDLRLRDYRVCAKSDGFRYLCYMAVDQFGIGMTYLIDRKNEYHSVQNACFGLKKGRDYVGDTLIDGEIVVSADEITDGIKYLVFDCLIVNGEDCRKLPLERRLKKFRQEFLEVNRIDSGQQGLAAGQVLIDVVVKEMMPAVCLPSLLDSIPRLDHNCDGIIFTPAYLPYRHGTHRHLLDSIPRLDHTCDGIIFTPAYLPYRHGTHRHLVTQMWDHIRSRIMTPAAPNVLSENYLKNK